MLPASCPEEVSLSGKRNLNKSHRLLPETRSTCDFPRIYPPIESYLKNYSETDTFNSRPFIPWQYQIKTILSDYLSYQNPTRAHFARLFPPFLG